MHDQADARTASWRDKPCDLCGEARHIAPLGERVEHAAGRSAIFEMRFHDAVCERCGFVFDAMIPDEGFLNDYYQDAHIRRSTFAEIAPDYDIDGRLDLIGRHVAAGAAVLEVGASDGRFIERLRGAGYDAIGIDPLDAQSEAVIAGTYVSAQTGLAAIGKRFDAIVSYYVLEHVTDARAWIRQLAAALRAGGTVILEVPDYERWPLESLVHEHFLHFTPFHLRVLLESMGFATLEVGHARASRYFGVVIAARLDDRGRLDAPPDGTGLAVNEGRAHAARARWVYRQAAALREAEAARTRGFVQSLLRRIAERPPGQTATYLWGANPHATQIAQALRALGGPEAAIIDSATTKIGLPHDGFKGPVIAPAFDRQAAGHRLFVLCSPNHNAEIAVQLAAMRIEDISVIDAAAAIVQHQPLAPDGSNGTE